MYRVLIFLSLIIFASNSFGASGVAKILKMRGNITFKNKETGESGTLKKGMWLQEKTLLRSEKKSFARILFIDKSTMTLGPNSEVEIKQFPKNKAGIINLVKGKIRSQVTKNYMKMKKDQSKLFITTRTAAMGVRGTDFMVTYSDRANVTSLVTYSGAVAMTKLASDFRQHTNQRALETQVSSDSAVMVKRGEYSKAGEQDQKSTAPVKINQLQLKTMKYDNNLQGSADKAERKSVVPPGINADNVANNSDSLGGVVKNIAGADSDVKAPGQIIKPQILVLAGEPVVQLNPAPKPPLVKEPIAEFRPPPPPPPAELAPSPTDIYELVNVNIHVNLR